jgi:carbonic anhydrase
MFVVRVIDFVTGGFLMTRRRFYGQLGLGRRDLIKALGAAGVGFVATTACSSGQNQQASAPSPAASPVAASSPDTAVLQRPDAENMTPDQALQLLIDGNKRFVEGKTVHPRQNRARLSETGADQFPFAAFLSCADSRVPVEEVFDQGVGDCFVTRVAGNIATPEQIGSLEFGTLVLGSKILMVIGHERCGAVVASMGRITLPDNPGKIPTLVPYIEPAVKVVQAETKTKGIAEVGNDVEETVKVNVMNQVKTLNTSPILSKLIKDSKLKIVGAYYDLDTGALTLLDGKKKA